MTREAQYVLEFIAKGMVMIDTPPGDTIWWCGIFLSAKSVGNLVNHDNFVGHKLIVIS